MYLLCAQLTERLRFLPEPRVSIITALQLQARMCARVGRQRRSPFYPVVPTVFHTMIKSCALLAVASGVATASPWAGQPSSNAAFVGAPVGRASPWGLGARWVTSSPTSTTARVGAVSRSAGNRLNALNMKLGEDEKVRPEWSRSLCGERRRLLGEAFLEGCRFLCPSRESEQTIIRKRVR